MTVVLDGGATQENGQRSLAGLILYGPDGPVSFITIAMDGQSGRPAAVLHTLGGGLILISFDESGNAGISIRNEDGTHGILTAPRGA